MADRDELARVVLRQSSAIVGREPATDDNDPFLDWHLIGCAYSVADAILASDWLARVRADEREACATLADALAASAKAGWENNRSRAFRWEQSGRIAAWEAIAAAIRERGQ